MPKYLFQVNYVGDGVKGLLKDGGSKRRTVASPGRKPAGRQPPRARRSCLPKLSPQEPDRPGVSPWLSVVVAAAGCVTRLSPGRQVRPSH